MTANNVVAQEDILEINRQEEVDKSPLLQVTSPVVNELELRKEVDDLREEMIRDGIREDYHKQGFEPDVLDGEPLVEGGEFDEEYEYDGDGMDLGDAEGEVCEIYIGRDYRDKGVAAQEADGDVVQIVEDAAQDVEVEIVDGPQDIQIENVEDPQVIQDEVIEDPQDDADNVDQHIQDSSPQNNNSESTTQSEGKKDATEDIDQMVKQAGSVTVQNDDSTLAEQVDSPSDNNQSVNGQSIEDADDSIVDVATANFYFGIPVIIKYETETFLYNSLDPDQGILDAKPHGDFSLEDLFIELRSYYPELPPESELYMIVRQLDLEIGEDNIYCNETTLLDLLRLLDTCEQEAESLRIQIQCRDRFISKLNLLFDKLNDLPPKKRRRSS